MTLSARTKVKPPSSISATVSTNGGFAINVSWTPTPSAWPASYYVLYRDEEEIATSLAVLNYRDTDVVEGGDYQYAVATVNVHEIEGDTSPVSNVHVPSYPVWQTGWSLSIDQNDTATVANRASDPDGGALVFSRAGGTAPGTVAVSSAGIVTVGATAAGSYTLTLRAGNGVLASDTTVNLTVVVILVAPGTPASFNANAVSTSQINLSWAAGAGVAPTSYELDRSLNGTSGWTNIFTGLATSFNDTGRATATQYFYRLRAINVSVASAYATDNETTQSPSGETTLLTEDFSSTTWYTKWHDPQTKAPYNGTPPRTTRVTPSFNQHGYVPNPAGSGYAMMVTIAQGTREGSTVSFYPRLSSYGINPTEMFLEYYLRLGSTFSGRANTAGKFPGISGDFDDGAKGNQWDANGMNGWSARSEFFAPCSGNTSTAFGSYIYHADAPQNDPGQGFAWDTMACGGANTIPLNTWVKIKVYAKANTGAGVAALANGIIRGWLDDIMRAERTNYRYTRNANYQFIDRAWMDVYHGGGPSQVAPQDLHIFIADPRIWVP